MLTDLERIFEREELPYELYVQMRRSIGGDFAIMDAYHELGGSKGCMRRLARNVGLIESRRFKGHNC